MAISDLNPTEHRWYETEEGVDKCKPWDKNDSKKFCMQ